MWTALHEPHQEVLPPLRDVRDDAVAGVGKEVQVSTKIKADFLLPSQALGNQINPGKLRKWLWEVEKRVIEEERRVAR